MAVIDENMHTAWRSVQIEYLRSENGPQLLHISGGFSSWAIVGRHKQAHAPGRLVRLQWPRDGLQGTKGIGLEESVRTRS